MSFQIDSADALVEYVKDFTGSTNDEEIKRCIFLAEMAMRNIELPALRSDPYAIENIGIANEYGYIPIPADMLKPILFFKQGNQTGTSATATGTSGATTITLTSDPSTTLAVGMIVSGTGIADGATITNAGTSLSGGTVTLSLANTATVSGTIVFYATAVNSSAVGPWIVYDRIGDRDIITQGMIAQLYLSPVNVPAVIRGKFSEVGQTYHFLPWIGEGAQINMYYYKAWPLLFAPGADQLISATGTVGNIVGAGPWTATIGNMTDITDVAVGDNITAVDDTGSLGGGTVTVTALSSSTQIAVAITGGTGPAPGTVTAVSLTNLEVQMNAVLQTWPEGYVYGTLQTYYAKRHNQEDAAMYKGLFDNAWNQVSDQNNLGKWSGGHTRMTSVWQPRQYRQYNIK